MMIDAMHSRVSPGFPKFSATGIDLGKRRHKRLQVTSEPLQLLRSSIWGKIRIVQDNYKLLKRNNASCMTRCSLLFVEGVANAVSDGSLDGIQQIIRGVAFLNDSTGLTEVARKGLELYNEYSKLPDYDRAGLLGTTLGGWIYLTARPGVLIGALDAYVFAPVQDLVNRALGRRSWKRTDFIVGERIGEGSFGTVFAGALVPRGVEVDEALGRRRRRIEEYEGSKSFKKVILKKRVKVGVQGAEECGEMEEWFNYRMRRAAPDACADFLGSFTADTTRGPFTEGGKWLVWKYEGDSTLADFMKARDFPENLGSVLFGGTLNKKDPLQRRGLIIKKIMREMITSLKKMHSTGIVHRDVKPSNLVLTNRGKLKLIDFGAATDLRVGKNYVPERGMLDPDYCPPELFVLPEKTPEPPPEPVAALLSPLIWQLNSPDLFDMYSAGVILLQMASVNLRTPVGFQSFKLEIAEVGYDLKKWRETTKLRPNLDVLDIDRGRGWDLATKLVCKRGVLRRGRLSAAAALRHPYFLLGGDQAATMLSKITLSK
ncbi:hypothetical protein O6H91_20G060400 [Diphasiastrum complanatum]|uniref:Uncharacterized protein n=1 Tax=Diphasiastrum complanatum TaxID=34168 RepID=A0ACC2AQW1_DIPCM|nr:hypothetical protein O6H91_20G060400 [Diphasiastrum complanatum]